MSPDGVADAVVAIRGWGESRDWRGYDPYDGLNSPLAGLLSAGTRQGRRALTQAVKLSPVNIRPVLGVRPALNPKAIGLVASAYARLGEGAAADRWLDWLDAHRAGDGRVPLWGYHFPVQTRIFRYARNAANTIATTFVLQAFLDRAEDGDERRLAIAVAGARTLVERMCSSGRRPFFRYLEQEDELIHNANALACAAVARVGLLAGDVGLQGTAAECLAVTLDAQRPDGSWPYSAQATHGWVDNFHTGYLLESLAICLPSIAAARGPLVAGVEYWRRELFLADGTPKYYPAATYPLDAHNYAQAVETWVAMRGVVPDALDQAERSARLLVEAMLDPRGFVVFQRRRRYVNRVPFVRWSTAPAFRALAGLLRARSRR